MTNYRHVEPIPPYASEADPWWWCEPCAADDHTNHVDAYHDIFGELCGCVCPNHD